MPSGAIPVQRLQQGTEAIAAHGIGFPRIAAIFQFRYKWRKHLQRFSMVWLFPILKVRRKLVVARWPKLLEAISLR
jgi:hypothetical protein